MKEYIDMFLTLYTESLPFMNLVLFIYVIYLISMRKEYFNNVERNFLTSTQNMTEEFMNKLSKYNIGYYDNLNAETDRMLINFNDNFKNKMKDMQHEVLLIHDEFKDFKNDIKHLKEEQTRLYTEVKNLNEEIRQRDAIISRKSKQIRELKNGK